MNIGIRIDTSGIKPLLDGRVKKAFEKSVTKSLNATAFDIQQSTRQHLPQWLNIRKQFLPRSVVYDKAMPANPNEVTVGFHERARLAPLLEMRGDRRPAQSRRIAVPIEVRRTKRGSVSQANKPKQLIAKKDIFERTVNNLSGIWQGTKSGALKLLYVLKSVTHYTKKHMRFEETARQVAQKNFVVHLRKNFMDQVNKLKKQ